MTHRLFRNANRPHDLTGQTQKPQVGHDHKDKERVEVDDTERYN